MYLSNPRRRKRRSTKSKAIRRKKRVVRSVTRRRKRRSTRRKSTNKIMKVHRRKRRSSRRKNRSITRRRRSSVSRGGSGILGMFKGIVNKDDLLIAGGAVASGVVTSQVINRFGTSLPGLGSTYGQVAYRVGIPVVAGILIRKYSPALAKGFIIGGFVTAINDVLTIATSGNPAVASTGAYLGAYPAGRINPRMSGAFNAVNQFGAAPRIGGENLFASEGAFTDNAWN